MSAALRIGVVGLGAMGLKHARTVAAHDEATLTGAVEPDTSRHSADIGCPIHTSVDNLIGAVDAAIIAVPTGLHEVVAAPLLNAGISCLIEKPLAATAADADRLRSLARGTAVIRVGHIERFNPAVMALMKQEPANVRAILARRISGASARVLDVDVVLDLMIHDIDVVLTLKQQPVIAVTSTGDRDHATATLTFADRTTATLIASRVAPTRIRDLDVLTRDAVFHVDYIARTLHESRSSGDGVLTNILPVPAHDALAAQLTAFIAAVRGTPAPVTATEAVAALEIAGRVQAALGI